MPPKVYLNLPPRLHGDFRAMPAFIQTGDQGVCGIKWVSVFAKNKTKGLPTVTATVILNSASTGSLLAVIEANIITAMRTAAAAALASRYLANPKPQKLAIVGAGFQAEYQLRALAAQYHFDKIVVWGFKPGEAEKFCIRLSRDFKKLDSSLTVKECVRDADIVVTCTPSRKPLVQKQWIKEGAHINAIGADAKGKQELDTVLLSGSKVVVDEWEQASHSGEINVPVSKGLFSKRHLYAELADVVSGKKKGRSSKEEITLFDSTGLAVLDICFAKYVFDQYKSR